MHDKRLVHFLTRPEIEALLAAPDRFAGVLLGSLGTLGVLAGRVDRLPTTYNLLFRCSVGLGMDDAVWNQAAFFKNRDRSLTSDVAQRLFAEVNKQARKFVSDEHFTVDGTLIQAWASQKSFRSKDGSDDGDGTDWRRS
jgi:hypothetical protein